MIIEMGFFVAIGLLATLSKLPWRAKLWVVSHPLLMDAIVFVVLIILHWGTFSGVMAATIGAFFCSVVLWAARKAIGYVENNRYYPGLWNVIDKLR